jgi:hypothetical protein
MTLTLWTFFCLLCCGPLLGQIPQGSVVPDGVGLNIHTVSLGPAESQLLAATGVRWIRMDLFWEETEHPKGTYDFLGYDRFLATLQSHGIRALLILDYGNKLYDRGAPPRTPETRQAFTNWAVAAVTHFRGRGIIWEMWNEPNGAFWRPPNAQEYSALALQVGEALRKAAPDETFVGPALGNIDMGYLEACLKAGLLNYWSAVSLHPYRDTAPESAANDYRQVRALIARYAHGKDVPVIDSEWGYPDHAVMDDNTQASMLSRMWLFNLSQHIPLTIWYDWVDPSVRERQDMLLLSFDSAKQAVFQPKPAYFAAKTLTSVLGGYHFARQLFVGGPGEYILLFSNGTDVRGVAWAVNPAPHPVLIPASPGNFRVITNTGQEGPALTAEPQGLKMTLTTSPHYFEPEGQNSRLSTAANGGR